MALSFFLVAGALLFSLSSPVVYADANLVEGMCETFRYTREDDSQLDRCKSCLNSNPASQQTDECGLTEMLFNCAISDLNTAREATTILLEDNNNYSADDPRRKPLEHCIILFRSTDELMSDAQPLFQKSSLDYEWGRQQVRNARILGYLACLDAFESPGNVPTELLHPITGFGELCQIIWTVTRELRIDYYSLCHQT